MEEITGYIENIVFNQPDNGFTVARLKEKHKSPLTTIVGYMPSLHAGESVVCKGKWISHKSHGMQFEVQEHTVSSPTDVLGIQKYLESGLIRGIGPAFAQKIVDTFGEDTLQVIDNTPHRLREVPGLGIKKIQMIQECWVEQRSIRDVMIFLRGHGVSPSYAQKIFKHYGSKSIEKVQENPYQLARDINGIGFKTADQIAGRLGYTLEAPARIDAGIEHILWELSNDGHTCFPLLALIEKSKEILQVEEEPIKISLQKLVKEERLIHEQLIIDEEKVSLIWLRQLHQLELGVAKELLRLAKTSVALRAIDLDKAIEWVQEKLSIEFAPEQKIGVEKGVAEKVHIITGGPGTGKSTITNAILTITEKLTKKILLVAPTGKAAKRMTQITQKKAFTLHAALEYDFADTGFKRNQDNPLQCDLVIVDEASMIDTQLMYFFLRAIPDHARVIFIGDIDQLPSIGAGFVLKDIISSNIVGVTCLTQIFRQAKNSQIITNAHRINHGEFPLVNNADWSDFHFIEKNTPEEIQETILDYVKTKIPEKWKYDSVEDIQVLSPMKKGMIGTESLNEKLQHLLNPSMHPFHRGGKRFHIHDKVMQIRNNYNKKVFNGDVGKVQYIDLEEQILSVSFYGKQVEYDFSELDELVLAYAVSIHKYQGSECPCIIIPMHTSHYKLLHRNLLYTGITRGKKRVILVGTKKAVAIAIHNNEVKKRYTGLKNALQKEKDRPVQDTMLPGIKF